MRRYMPSPGGCRRQTRRCSTLPRTPSCASFCSLSQGLSQNTGAATPGVAGRFTAYREPSRPSGPEPDDCPYQQCQPIKWCTPPSTTRAPHCASSQIGPMVRSSANIGNTWAPDRYSCRVRGGGSTAVLAGDRRSRCRGRDCGQVQTSLRRTTVRANAETADAFGGPVGQPGVGMLAVATC